MMILYPYGLRKALTLSYDDGVETDIELVRILDEYGILATFNLNSGCFAPEGTVYPAGTIHRRMSESAIKALYAGGRHEIASHALTHASLSASPAPRIAYEVLADRDNLEKLFGKIVRGFAYPYGTYSDEAVDTLRTCGIAYARTVVSTHNFEIPNEWLRLHPTCHHDDPKLDELCDRFLTGKGPFGLKLFYLWGHSYEFEQHNNWEVIRAFCEKMSGKKDIWYATNIEIVDYLNASRQLRTSADGHIVFNPTSTDIWVENKGEVMTIKAGETVRV